MEKSTEEKSAEELIQECLCALADAPPRIVKTFKGVFSELSDILNEHPETVQKILPFLLRILGTLFDGKWYEALGYLSLLIVLIGCEYTMQERSK